MRLVVGSQGASAVPLWILDRGPVPAEALDEFLSFVRSVGDVDAEVRDLRVLLLERCVGDRLALARASPRGPDVDEHRSTSVVGERDGLVVERPACDRRCSLAPGRGGLRVCLGRRRSRACRVLSRAAPAAARDDERRQYCHEHLCERTHASTVITSRADSGGFHPFERCGSPARAPIGPPCAGSPPSRSQCSCWRLSSA